MKLPEYPFVLDSTVQFAYLSSSPISLTDLKLFDHSQYRRHATITGTYVTPGVGSNGGRYFQNSTNSKIVIGTTPILGNLTNSSLIAWIRSDRDATGSSGESIYCERGANDIFKIEISPVSGAFQFAYRNDSNVLASIPETSPVAIDLDGKIHQLVVTCEGTSVKLYRDGVLTLTGGTRPAVAFTQSVNVLIGGDATDTNEWFGGMISRVIGFSRTLSAKEIREDYEAYKRNI